VGECVYPKIPLEWFLVHSWNIGSLIVQFFLHSASNLNFYQENSPFGVIFDAFY